MFSHEFRMLIQEARLTQASLLSGLEFLRKADYDQPGSFYAAFFQLSIGLERLFKLVIILDHKARHDRQNPTDRQLRAVGHELVGAYQACRTIAGAQDSKVSQWFEPDSLEGRLLGLLAEFAAGSRYYNLDQLAGAGRHEDPLTGWYGVHTEIANHYISHSRQAAINALAIRHCDSHGLFGWERGLDGQFRPQVDGVFLHELFLRSSGYCVWTVIRILRPFHALLRRQCQVLHAMDDAHGRPQTTVPELYEFFPFFLSDRAASLRRRRWIRFVG
ncbi:hypothetical protein LJR225_003481 [Phenylobacterium sp. LjRoot225]|uniref:hypothetical protein n=1 Tax=Phenylobacterium sp. LjRoot225 TaxID=3342285 RepID=UPI003ECCDD2B